MRTGFFADQRTLLRQEILTLWGKGVKQYALLGANTAVHDSRLFVERVTSFDDFGFFANRELELA